jgi:hypothetical protein
VRPPRADIAAPELPPRVRWLNGEAPPMAELVAAGPVLVHFFDFAHLSSVRALDYLSRWHERYAGAGLAVLGAHSPRFSFSADRDALAAALDRLTVSHPIADDSSHAIWDDYGCQGWPSLYLWGQGGALRYFHFGEGEYRATEEAIQEELRALDATLDLPAPLAPLRPTDSPGALLPRPTAEILPGGSINDPWQARAGSEAIEVGYEAGGAHATVDGAGELAATIDGVERTLTVDHPGLYDLASHAGHGSHRLLLRPSGGIRVWSLSFSPGMPQGSP